MLLLVLILFAFDTRKATVNSNTHISANTTDDYVDFLLEKQRRINQEGNIPLNQSSLIVFPIEAASNVSEYPFGYSETLVGTTPSPDQCADAPRRTRLTAWLYRSLWSLIPALRAGEEARNTLIRLLFLLFFLLWQSTRNPVNILLRGLVVYHFFPCYFVFLFEKPSI